MNCPRCNVENLPIRESTSYVGASVYHPHFCGSCGAVLTEKCAVCRYQHPIGTRFCLSDGRDIAIYVAEHARWLKILDQNHGAIKKAESFLLNVQSVIFGRIGAIIVLLLIGSAATFVASYVYHQPPLIIPAISLLVFPIVMLVVGVDARCWRNKNIVLEKLFREANFTTMRNRRFDSAW